MKTISLFTPCYNEEGNIYALYKSVTEVMKKIPEYDYEYIFIDNASTDNTQNILRKIAEEDKRVKAIFNVRNFGPSRSGSYGFFQTSGDVSICLACDFQDPPELIPEFIKKWEEGYKVVWGKKLDSEESKWMYAIRSLYYTIVKSMAESKQYDNVTGFGLYDREVMDLLRKSNDPTPNLRNLIGEYGYEVGMVEYHQPKRKSGKSSYNFFKYYTVAINSLIITSRVPLRIATFFGTIVAGLSFFVGLIYFILKLIFWDSFSFGMAPLVSGLFFLGAVQLLFIGILGEYIGEILVRQMNRPLVVEKERINF
ncbi:MAG: glycosyltransferase family 2 protein [Lachnospiraceae bacterium]|jgi:glycosyltransferase involved in cell wall biosynthesis|nr:glycosyltransferase family 2 protein [Lachnospiraceae bacterium]